MLEVVGRTLVTPVGLRTLAPDSASYQKTYTGDLRARDAAYHQGTVWPWLIGPWIDAYLRANPDDRAGARRFLDGLLASLDVYGVGTLAEIFEAEPPLTPRGCHRAGVERGRDPSRGRQSFAMTAGAAQISTSTP